MKTWNMRKPRHVSCLHVSVFHLHSSKHKLIPERFVVPLKRQRQPHFRFAVPVPVGGVVFVVQHVVTWCVIIVIPGVPVRPTVVSANTTMEVTMLPAAVHQV